MVEVYNSRKNSHWYLPHHTRYTIILGGWLKFCCFGLFLVEFTKLSFLVKGSIEKLPETQVIAKTQHSKMHFVNSSVCRKKLITVNSGFCSFICRNIQSSQPIHRFCENQKGFRSTYENIRRSQIDFISPFSKGAATNVNFLHLKLVVNQFSKGGHHGTGSTKKSSKEINGEGRSSMNKNEASSKPNDDLKNKKVKTKSKANRNKKAIRTKQDSSGVKDYPPKIWSEQYERILLMRAQHVAEVDEYGCAAIGQLLSDGELKMIRLRTLIASLFSSQTKDKTNALAMQRLTDLCNNSQMSLDNLETLTEYDIAEAIKGISFHNTKAKNLMKILKILRNEYNGDIPSSYEELLTLPGIGPKMAHLVMTHAIGETVGICVDTHGK